MKKVVTSLLIFCLMAAPAVSISGACSNMDNVDSISTAFKHANSGATHQQHQQASVVNETHMGCECPDNINCVGHASAYVTTNNVVPKSLGLSSIFITYSAIERPNESLSPEIKPPRPSA